ncbi:MAG: cytochrome c [Bacteroidota bacterium]
MTRYPILIFLSLFVVDACKTKTTSFAQEYLKTSKLTSQGFTIDPATDTVLLSQSGIRIHIEPGTFSGTEKVNIDFKEALDFESMLQAGLFTMSDGKMLSSAGMFYFNTKENLAINKPIGIEVPTQTALDGMQLFKGDMTDGAINWEDPQPLAMAPAKMAGIDGKALFENLCASCHKVDKDLTGPALAGVRERWSKRWGMGHSHLDRNIPISHDSFKKKQVVTLDSSNSFATHNRLYDYTRNNQKYLQQFYFVIDIYACCVFNKWNKTAMTLFPNLTDADLDALYKYIDDESERLGLSVDKYANNCDSCDIYRSELEQLETERQRLVKTNDKWVTVIPDTPNNNPPPLPLPNFKQEVKSISKNADYYKITIKETGWFNIDILLNERNNVAESTLIVRLQGNYEKKFQVFLAIPQFKVFAEGGYLESSKEIGFKYADGTMPLPQNVQALVFAMGEEKGQFYFAKQWFNTQTNQTITLGMRAMTKRNFEIEVSKIQQPGLDFSTDTSKNINSLKAIDEKLEKINKDGLKDCNCGATAAVTVYYEYTP